MALDCARPFYEQGVGVVIFTFLGGKLATTTNTLGMERHDGKVDPYPTTITMEEGEEENKMSSDKTKLILGLWRDQASMTHHNLICRLFH